MTAGKPMEAMDDEAYILGMDEPEHGRYRALLEQALSKQAMEQVEVIDAPAQSGVTTYRS